jgi:hypothetical protein
LFQNPVIAAASRGNSVAEPMEQSYLSAKPIVLSTDFNTIAREIPENHFWLIFPVGVFF